ncbi:MAG: hypothetical protein A2X55_00840 [Nitrospirae bacterium GWB2_47_37]|nr:MAG: hypothetical protein A2Z82_08480 [Nitrospirae bacterium GWA2_46_11]OGW25394.1 MAG: hypothetical protein A2X55_00840 [Nitrospirae bacterium GWB2_47_37]
MKEMQWSGWINFGITAVLFIVFIIIVVHYYKPRKKSELEHFENPKYKMLNDDDEAAGAGGHERKK